MQEIKVLDCTLRDGGYCNQWEFGLRNIQKIGAGLCDAGIDMIECGFLTNRCNYEEKRSKYTTMEEAVRALPENRAGRMFVCMINFGEYELEQIPERSQGTLDGVRVAFHKDEREAAIKFCQGIKDKGYEVFTQPMVSLDYTDLEFLQLIELTNQLKPYAFYIVDSFGVMRRKDLIRLYYLVEHNLRKEIRIGFHSHNNLQLSYSNAQTLVEIQGNRRLIIDSSIYGMGRGAGNLNTELFVEFLNDTVGTCYQVKPLLKIIDECLYQMYQEKSWGYSLPQYISAKYHCHPNYASCLSEMNRLTVENIEEILSRVDKKKKSNFDQTYLLELYKGYMSEKKEVNEENLNSFAIRLSGRSVLLIAPGSSIRDEREKILKFAAEENPIVVSLNFFFRDLETEYIFVGNQRRYNDLDEPYQKKAIITSNIDGERYYIKTNYVDLLNEITDVQDNTGMMAIKFFIKCNAGKIYLAGMDGYSPDYSANYADKELATFSTKETVGRLNKGLREALVYFGKKVNLIPITKTRLLG